METLQFRKAEKKDAEKILLIIEEAKKLLAEQNSPQWQNGYPNREVIDKDIVEAKAYVLIYKNDLVGTIALQKEPEKNYETISEGQWSNPEQSYVTIHRIAVASNYRRKNFAMKIIELAQLEIKKWGFSQIRVDTHRKNKGMQRLLEKSGFQYKGIVWVDGYSDNERLAYQKVVL